MYSIRDDNAITEAYYYNIEGKLLAVDYIMYAKNIYTKADMKKYPSNEQYPAKRYRHSYPDGKLRSIIMDTKSNEIYIFKSTGELTGHCIGPNCYNANNQLIMTRTE